MIPLPLSSLLIDGMLIGIGDEDVITTPLDALVLLVYGVIAVVVVITAAVGTNKLTGGTGGLAMVKNSFKPPLASILAAPIELKTFAISPVLSLPLSVLLLLSLSMSKSSP
ncbi:hypothetical protein Tco_0392520 [Tanacetum coccineum]